METFRARGWVDAPKTASIADARDLSNGESWNLNDTAIYCRDESGMEVKYTVVDYGTSATNGNYYELEDDQGRVRQVTEDELEKIRAK